MLPRMTSFWQAHQRAGASRISLCYKKKMATNKDYYQSLGISKTASDTEIKAAYRKAALQWHPDRNKSGEAITKFKEVTEAYEVLSDPKKRQTYDQFGSAAFEGASTGGYGDPRQGGNPFGGFQQGPFNYSYSTPGGENPFGGDFSDPFELFEQFFGGGFSTGRRQRRPAYSLSITFMEAVKGVEKQVDINGKETKIKVPAGVDNGTRVRFNDFDIVLSVKPDPQFERDGNDLYVVIDLDFVNATLGTTITVPTIDGSVSLRVPSGTQPDTLIRLKSRGVPNPRGGQPGDQYVKIKIKIPTKLTREQKDLLEKFQEAAGKRSGWF